MSSNVITIGYDGRFQNSLENPALSLDDPATWDAAGLMGEKVSSGVTVNLRSAMGYPPFYRAINLISGDTSRLPFRVYKAAADGGKEPAKDHPAYRLARKKANAVMRSQTFIRTLTAHALARGNGYAGIIRDGAGKPREEIVLDPETTCPVQIVDDFRGETELWYVGWAGGKPFKIPARDMLHIRGLSHDGISGVDVLTLMSEALGLGMATRKWVSSFFGNGTQVSGVLMIPENFSDDKMKNVLRHWADTATGIAKSSKVALLKEGVKFVPISSKPEESAATGILEHEIMMVSCITGVPPHKLGDKNRTSYNSLEISGQDYLDDCLDVWLCEWESECNEKLLTEEENESETYFHEFNRSARLRMDATARGNLYKTYRETGVLSVNDVLRKESLPTIGPEGDKRHIPMNWQELGAKPPEPKPAPAPRNGPPPNHNVRAAHRNLLTTILDAKIEIERSKVTRAAGKENLKDWLPAFYADHQTHLWNAILPLCRAWEAISDGEAAQNWQNALASFLGAHRASIESSENVTETVSGWSAAEFVDVLIPPPPAKGAA